MTRIAVLVSDRPYGALHQRAIELFRRLPDCFQPAIACHEGGIVRRITSFVRYLRDTKPDVIYLLDPIYAAVAALRLYGAVRLPPLVVDTGDLVYELAREVGHFSVPALAVIRSAEQTALRMANHIVVRGEYHREWLAARGKRNVSVIPDGVDMASFFPTPQRPWRERLGIRAEELVVGGVGSLTWNARQNTCYGWDLVDALAFLRDVPVRGVLYGDGEGLEHLRRRAFDLGVADRMLFAGRVAYSDLNDALNALDIAIISAPDTEVSHVRTTGKLPLFLACDRYVIATAVGTAAHLLAPLDMLLPYNGAARDESYPLRLANKIHALLASPTALRLEGRGVELAKAHFDYDRLATMLCSLLDTLS